MTPKEKAKELIEKFRDDPFTSQITTKGAKACAIVCVDEILKALGSFHNLDYWLDVNDELLKYE